MSQPREEAILTLEPLIDVIREGIEGKGWALSGLQKTTSHQFEGRWEGESTRSAYLFFHSDEPLAADVASIDVYLDETTKGLTGNLALVVDLVPLGALGDPSAALARLARVSRSALDRTRRRPLTLRLRLGDADADASDADVEVRFKVSLARSTIAAGPSAVRALALAAVDAFEGILAAPDLAALVDRD